MSADLAEELARLTARVSALERRLGLIPVAPKPAPGPVPEPPQPAEEGAQAGRVLGVVAALCFVLAAAYLIKLAVDSGWLTPVRQLGLASLFGIALVSAGLWLAERDLPYAGILPGAGVVVLYMSAFGGSLYYGLYGPWAAAGAAAAATAVAVGLFRLFRHDFYVVVACVGTYLTPLLLPALAGGDLDSMAFFLAWDAVFAALAVGLRSRGILTVAAYLALGVFAFTSPAGRWSSPPDSVVGALLFQHIQLMVFAWASLDYSVRHKSPMTASEAWGAFPVLLFFYGLEYSWLNRIAPAMAPWLALGFGAAVYAGYALVKDRLAGGRLDSGPMVTAFASAVLFHAVYLELLPAALSPWLAVALLAAAPLARERLELGGRHLGAGIAAAAVVAAEYLKAAWGFGTGLEAAVVNAAFAAVLLAYRAAPTKAGGDGWLFVLLAGQGQALVAVTRLAAEFAPPGGERFLVTGGWALLGAALVLWGRARRDPLLARSAMLSLGAAAAKGLLVDVAGNEPVVRIACLVVLGGLLYVSGLLLREARSWEDVELKVGR